MKTLRNWSKGVAFFGVLISLSACSKYAAEKNLDAISLHMDKEDVIRKMSSKGVARGSIINKYGQSIEVREYEVEKDKSGKRIGGEVAITLLTLGFGAPILFTDGEIETYWLYFCDGKLVQWGRAGDWAEAQRMVYDVNFNVTSNS